MNMFYFNEEDILKTGFYERDTSTVAAELIGKVLVKRTGDLILGGVITETEAYYGESDPASHAFRGRTRRTDIMFGRAGIAYVYLCYGMYYLLNAVTEMINTAGAVLIRSVLPVYGIEKMVENREIKSAGNKNKGSFQIPENFIINEKDNSFDETDIFKRGREIFKLADGPGKVTIAFGISGSDNKADLTDPYNSLNIIRSVNIDSLVRKKNLKILKSPRIGISAGKDRHLRFYFNL